MLKNIYMHKTKLKKRELYVNFEKEKKEEKPLNVGQWSPFCG